MKRRNAHEGRPPAWPKFARDWLTSESVLAMPRAARSLYDDLLCHQWLNESLPADPVVLARMTGETPESFKELWAHVEACFEAGEDGRLRNPRLEKERVSSEEFRAKKAAAGLLGADKTNSKRAAERSANGRHHRTSADTDAERPAEAPPTHLPSANGRLSSSSSSASAYHSSSDSARANDPSKFVQGGDVANPPESRPSKMLEQLGMHEKLNRPDVRAALAEFEEHRNEIGEPAWSTRSSSRLLHQWSRRGPEWLLRAVEAGISLGRPWPIEPKGGFRDAASERGTVEDELTVRYGPAKIRGAG